MKVWIEQVLPVMALGSMFTLWMYMLAKWDPMGKPPE